MRVDEKGGSLEEALVWKIGVVTRKKIWKEGEKSQHSSWRRKKAFGAMSSSSSSLIASVSQVFRALDVAMLSQINMSD